jgi:hypothetical protein
MLGPSTVLAGGAFVAWLAIGHPDALVVDDYYKQGKAINQDLRRDLRLFVRPAVDGAFSVALPALERTHWQVVVEGGLRDWRLAKEWDGVRALEIVADQP